MLISEDFFKSIPKGYENIILSKMNKFEKELLICENKIRNLASGYWVKLIKNTNIFKFRLNNKDRILFTFIKKRNDINKKNILFLKYVNHDEQIRLANNIQLQNIKSIEINKDVFNHLEINNEDSKLMNIFPNGIVDINKIKAIMVSDEDLKLVNDKGFDDYMYYLSDEQYEIFNFINKPVIIHGAAGTGKTIILLNLLEYGKEFKKNILYVSNNPLLVDATKKTFNKKKNTNTTHMDFLSIRDLENILYEDKKHKLIELFEIENWLEKAYKKYKLLKNKDLYEILTEVKGILKGYMGLEFKEKFEIPYKNNTIISLDKYLKIPKQYTNFSQDEKFEMYNLANDYQKWLFQNNYLDANDIARKIILQKSNKKWDWILVDEVQDLSEVQIYMITTLLEANGNTVWTGDINQTINPTFFNYARLKNLYYSKNSSLNFIKLTKNYRNTKKNIELINDVSKLKRTLIGASTYDNFEIGIREGSPPKIIEFDEVNLSEMFKSVKNKHYCAIVVANIKEKERLILKYPKIEARIFTTYEIKGLEYENIICFNILSAYLETWIKISNGLYKNNNNMKYYFNLLYCSLSRAKDSIFIYESHLDELDFNPFLKCAKLNNFSIDELNLLKNSTSSDWEDEAEKLEKIGQLHKAKLIRDYKAEKILYEKNRKIDNNIKGMYHNVDETVEIKDEIDKALKDGIVKYRYRQYTYALDIFQNVLDIYPESSKVYYYIALSYGYMDGGIEYCIRFFEKGIQLNPDEYEYYIDMAGILSASGNYKRALEVLDIADKKFSEYGNAKELKSIIYFELKEENLGKWFEQESKKRIKLIYDQRRRSWKSKQINQLKLKDKVREIKQRTELDYLKGDFYNTPKQCINKVNFKSFKFNPNKKSYCIEFDILECKKCKDSMNCIVGKNNYRKKTTIKQKFLNNMLYNDIQQVELRIRSYISSTEYITISEIIRNIETSESVYEFIELIKFNFIIYKQNTILEKIDFFKKQSLYYTTNSIGDTDYYYYQNKYSDNIRKELFYYEVYYNYYIKKLYQYLSSLEGQKHCEKIKLINKNILNSYLDDIINTRVIKALNFL